METEINTSQIFPHAAGISSHSDRNLSPFGTFWKTAIKKFHKIVDQGTVYSIISRLENTPLILDFVSKGQQTFRGSSIINSDMETLTIDKPRNFIEAQKPIRMFFQESPRLWTLIETQVVRNSTYTLILKRPKSIYQYQSRKYQRISTPKYSSAFYCVHNKIHYGGLVKDLSRTGMLLCAGITVDELSINSTLEQISILLPRDSSFKKNCSDKNSLLLGINKGIIVHSCHDPEKNCVFYGISFEDKICNELLLDLEWMPE